MQTHFKGWSACVCVSFRSHKYPVLLEVFKFKVVILNVRIIWFQHTMQSQHPYTNPEGRCGEIVFHSHATFLFTPNVELTGLLPYFKIHGSETAALASLSSKRSTWKRKWGACECGRNSQALSLPTAVTLQKGSKMEQDGMLSVFALLTFYFSQVKFKIRREGRPENKHPDSLEVHTCGQLSSPPLCKQKYHTKMFIGKDVYFIWSLAHSKNSGKDFLITIT